MPLPASSDQPSEPAVAASSSSWTGFFRGFLAVGGVWALAVARPVYGNIAIGPEALTDLGLRRLDLLVLIVVVSLLVPAVVAGSAALLGRFASSRAQTGLVTFSVALLTGLFVWQLVKDSGPAIRLLLPLLAFAAIAWLVVKSDFTRNFFLVLGFATPVVIVSFLINYPVWQALTPVEKSPDVPAITADTPVVMVIFDELPLAALEDSHGRIDSKLFPNFAALARKSSWYPDMTASGTETILAVPAVMTGQQPTVGETTEPPPPGLPQHPDNVCSIAAAGGYEVHAYQAIGDLCPREFGLGSRITAAIRRGTGAATETSNVKLTPGSLAPKVANVLAGPFRQPRGAFDAGRQGVVDDFIAGMPDNPRSLSLLHVTLPHIPWEFMPDGTHYVSNRFAGGDLATADSKAQATHDMQQMMLQLVYTDHELGRVIRRMKELGTWDEALFVVTADHGGSFVPKDFRRIPDLANSGWILPIPLFIKYPGQTHGKVVPGDATSLDVAPTIYDTLSTEAPSVSQGTSLAGKSRLPITNPLTSHGYFGIFKATRKWVDALFDQARNQRNETFSGGELFALAGHRDLLGKAPGKIAGLTPVDSAPDDAAALADVDTSSEDLPSYLKATVTTPGVKPGTPLAVALNGKIVATTRTWSQPPGVVTGVNLPDQDFVEGSNRVDLYAMGRTATKG